MKRTRIIPIAGDRDAAEGSQTLVLGVSDPIARLLPPPRDVFLRHYRQIRDLVTGWGAPGVAVFTADNRGAAAAGCFSAHPDRVNSSIVGRHKRADFFVDRDPSVSLRHLALLTLPLGADRVVRYRVLDLRTPIPFRDESGRELEALEADGPVFLTCAGYHVMLFPTSEGGVLWPARGEDAWDALQDRVFMEHEPSGDGDDDGDGDDEASPPSRASEAGRGNGDGHVSAPTASDDELSDREASFTGRRRGTSITSLPGPLFTEQTETSRGSRIVAHLVLPQGEEATAAELPLTRASLDRGVLLGRYDRCDNADVGALTAERVSRVHALLIRVDGRIWVIDTASTNGLFHRGERRRQVELPADRPAEFGLARGVVRWVPAR